MGKLVDTTWHAWHTGSVVDVAGEKWFDHGALGWLVRYTASDGWINFKAYEVYVRSIDGTNPEFAVKDNRKAGSPTLGQSTTDPDKSVPDIVGFVKWDGCMEFTTELGSHFCGAQDIAAYAEMLKELHALCKLLPSVDLDCAGYDG